MFWELNSFNRIMKKQPKKETAAQNFFGHFKNVQFQKGAKDFLKRGCFLCFRRKMQ
jgi:hypothetical protein